MIVLLGVPALVLGTVSVRRWRARPIPQMAAPGVLVAAVGESPVGDYTCIRLSRKRFLPLLLFLIPLIGFMAFALVYIALNPVDVTTEAWAFAIFGPLTLFLAWWAFMLLRRLVSDRPALSIDDEGFTNASEILMSHRIQWREIERLRWVRGLPLYLAVDLSSPAEYLARQAGWRGLVGRWNWRTRRNPLRINVTALDVSPNELGTLLEGRVPIVDDRGPWSSQH
jgi:hypothetical protein